MVCERSDAFASACALARAFPLFTHRSGASRRPEKKTVTVEFFLVGQDNGPVEVSTLQVGVWKLRPCPLHPQLGQCSLPHTPWEDRTGLLLLERAGPRGLSKARPQAPSHKVVLFSGFNSIQPVFMSTYLAPGAFVF